MQAVIWIVALSWPPALGAVVWSNVGHVAGILAAIAAYLLLPLAVITTSIELPNTRGLERAVLPLYVLVYETIPAALVAWIAGLFNY